MLNGSTVQWGHHAAKRCSNKGAMSSAVHLTHLKGLGAPPLLQQPSSR